MAAAVRQEHQLPPVGAVRGRLHLSSLVGDALRVAGVLGRCAVDRDLPDVRPEADAARQQRAGGVHVRMHVRHGTVGDLPVFGTFERARPQVERRRIRNRAPSRRAVDEA